MKKNAWKMVLCLALAAAMLMTGVAMAAIAQGDVAAAQGTTITVGADGKLTVAVSGVTTGSQYALLQVKVNTQATSAAELLADPPAYDVGEDTILYLDQFQAADGKVTFANFQPMMAANSLFILGGDTEPKVVGAMVSQGVTVTGTVTAKGATSGTATVELFQESSKVGEGTATIGANGTGTYTIDGVANGQYTMKVSSGTKYVAREYTVNVTGALTQNVEIWPKGDVNGDGNINMTDYTGILRHVKQTSTLTDYALQCANADGASGVNMTDYTAVLRHVKQAGSLWK